MGYVLICLVAGSSLSCWYISDKPRLPLGWRLWLALSAAIGIGVYEVPRIQVRRSLKNNPSAQGEIVYIFDDKGSFATFPTGESRLDWGAYTKYQETGTTFFVVLSSLSKHVDPETRDVA
jgi:hypothetical protein